MNDSRFVTKSRDAKFWGLEGGEKVGAVSFMLECFVEWSLFLS